MFLNRIKLVGVAVLAVVLSATGAVLFAQREAAERPAAAPAGQVAGRDGARNPADVRGVLRAVDATQNTLTLAGSPQGREAAPTPDKTFTLAKDAEVFLDEGRGQRSVVSDGKLADLVAGALVTLRLSADQKTVEAVLAEGPTVQGQLGSVDPTKGTVTLTMKGVQGRGEEAVVSDKTYTVGKNAEIVIDDGRGRRTSIREAKLVDLTAGTMVSLKLSANQKEAVFIHSQGPTVQGLIKAVDAAKQTLTLTLRPARGDEAAEEKTFAVASTTDILVEDHRPRRFFPVREAKLAELPVGAMAMVRLAPDQSTAVMIRAEGPNVFGALKGVDPTKGTITVIIGQGRNTDGEEKTYNVAKDAAINVEGLDTKLADVKVGDTPAPVSLRLSLDQTTVRAITIGRGR